LVDSYGFMVSCPLLDEAKLTIKPFRHPIVSVGMYPITLPGSDLINSRPTYSRQEGLEPLRRACSRVAAIVHRGAHEVSSHLRVSGIVKLIDQDLGFIQGHLRPEPYQRVNPCRISLKSLDVRQVVSFLVHA